MSRLSRRDLLRSAACLAAVPAWLRGSAAAAAASGRSVVIVQLHGGNDGLNTIVPVEDDLYHRARPDLAVKKSAGLPLDEHHRWHPSLANVAQRFREGGVAAIQGVGYPRPNLSHFTSLDIWHSASLASPPPAYGWIGRFADAELGESHHPLSLLSVGHDVAPHMMRAKHGLSVAVPRLDVVLAPNAPMDAGAEEVDARRGVLEQLERATSERSSGRAGRIAEGARAARQVALDLARASDFEPRVEWPDSALARDLDLVARVLARDLPSRFFFVSQQGYDTHALQGGPHAGLLATLDAALGAFLAELDARELTERVLVMTISDFGRRVAQNGVGENAGTDHGAASVQLLFGGGIEPGLHGAPADLADLDEHGNLRHRVDFRSVYAAVIERWLGADATRVLGPGFAAHPAVKG